jgi:hypothetical protein
MGSNPIGQIEEAIFLLRRQDLQVWSQYLLASVPLLLAVLKLVHDMSAGYLARRCAAESLVCALTFFWASAWKAKFGGTLLASMSGSQSAAPQAGFWHSFYLQGVLQTFKLAALPFAIVSILPIAWTSSFFRNATIEASLPGNTLGSVMVKSAKRANLNARGNWLGVAILIVIFLLTFLNVYVSFGVMPFLLRMFSGVETEFTRSVASLFTFNVFCVVTALTWLIVDPLFLAYAVVRCFYAEARTDGRDLLTKLRPALVALLLLLTFAPTKRLSAEDLSGSVSKEKLAHAIQRAERSDDYAWLRAHQPNAANEDSFFAHLVHDIDRLADTVGSWFSDFRRWVSRLLEKNKPQIAPESKGRPASGDVRWLMYSLAAVVVVGVLVFLWRSSISPADPILSSSAATQTPDLNKENVLASDLPEEEWLRLARELLDQGELRLAIRAMYLSNLSYLGSQRFIQVARAKSNSIYERELRLRPRGNELSVPFAQSNRSFERAWYGFHEVTPEFVDTFQQSVEALRQHAKA